MRILLVAPEGVELPVPGAWQVKKTASVAEALQGSDEEFAAVILDLSLAEPGTAARLMERRPLLLLGPPTAMAHELLRVGAQDIVPPSASAEELQRAVDYARSRFEAVEREFRRLAGAIPPEPHLRECQPEIFRDLARDYAHTLDEALQRRGYRVSEARNSVLQAFAERLVDLGATPRDVVEIHAAAVRTLSQRHPRRASSYLQEGRLLVLELMGHLAWSYRQKVRP